MNNEIYNPKIEKSFLKKQVIKPKEKKFDRKERDISRRDCLKRLTYITASFAASASGFNVFKKIPSDDCSNEKVNEGKNREILEIEDAFQEITEHDEKKKYSEQEEKEYKTISEIFKLGLNQPIEINMQNSLATKEFWKKQHSENPDYVNSFKMAWKRMEKYEKELKAIFKKEGVPEEFIYLSIPESYWNCEKRPGKKAKGVFQITKDTGRRYGMTINNKIDDRDDPIKSGCVAARHLADSHKITGNRDIDLAAYNGSMANRYLEKTSINQNAHKNFSAYIEDQTSEEQEFILAQNLFNYTVSEEDNSIWGIAHRFGTSIQEIRRRNSIKPDNKIIPGQILKISVPDQEKIKKSKRSYEGFLAYMQDEARQEKKEILALEFFKYNVNKGDTVSNVTRRFNISAAELKSENNIGDNNEIYLGQTLKIPISQDIKKKFYKIAMSKYIENLNYPPKFNAIMELIDEGFVKRDKVISNN